MLHISGGSMRKEQNITRINAMKITRTASVLTLIQSVLLLFFCLYFLLTKTSIIILGTETNIIFFLIVMLLLSTFNGLILLRTKYQVNRTYKENDNLMLSYSELEELNNSLRMQRHEFKNSLQVIYSLIELNEYEEAASFINETFLDIQKLSRFLKTANPAINALLQAKVHDLENSGINVLIDIKTNAEKLGMPAWEYCRVLGNLLDNAREAFWGSAKRVKEVRIKLYEDISFHWLEIHDNAGQISEDDISKIFDAGFTTKNDKERGMGLYITKKIIEENNGSIAVSQNGEYKVFRVSVPVIV